MSGELDSYERNILDHVAAFGCSVTNVFDPDGDSPSFSYSIGFTKSVDQPEVIVFGLDTTLMHRMINETLRLCQAGLDLEEGGRIAGVLDGFDVVSRAIPTERITRGHFNSAMWYHRREFGSELTRAMQLVWPSSKTGLFPWQPDCHQSVIDAQPALYEPRLNQ